MGVGLLYNSVKTEVAVGVGRSYRREVVKKATPGRRGSGPPIELWCREVSDKMYQITQQSGPPVEQPWRTRKTQR